MDPPDVVPIIPMPSGLIQQPLVPARCWLVLLGFFGFCNMYAVRVVLSVAIVAMVHHSDPPEDTSLDMCPMPNASISGNQSLPDGFDWNSKVQGIVLGSFFYGYICTQILGGWLAQRFGGKHPFGCAGLGSGLLALFIPLAAKWHYGALIGLRVLQGMFQGVSFPSMHAMMGLWAPPLERSWMVAFTYTGVQFGTVGALIMSGVLIQRWGWECVFYVFGCTSISWYIFWIFFAFDCPKAHPRISLAELLYINETTGSRGDSRRTAVPWKKILRSVPVWALCVANFGHNWGFYTLLTNIPTYLSKVLHYGIEDNGLLSALPYLVMAIVMQVAGFTADFIRKRNLLNTTCVRRVFHLAGQLLPALFLVLLGYVGCDHYGAIALLILAVGSDGLASPGSQVNHVDLSPPHAGFLMGLTNTWGTIPGFIGPYVVGWLTDGPMGHTIAPWQKVFYIAAAVYWITAISFSCFVSGEQEKWEKDQDDEPLLVDNGS